MGAAPRSEASVGALLGMIAQDSGDLVRQELRLASFEVIDRAKSASGKIGVIALGGGLAHAGLLGLLTAAALGLATFMPLWAAAILLGAIFSFAGLVFIFAGMKALERPRPNPNPTSSAAGTAARAFVPAKEAIR